MATENGTFVTSDGYPIAYTRHGADRGQRLTRVALIHSLALDRSVWDAVVPKLEGRAEVLTYDARGHGRSGRPHMEYSAELFARDLNELFDHLGWENAVVAGCSMGGCVAQAFAGLFPKKARALLLIDTTAWYGPDAPKQFRERAAAAKAKGMGGLIDFQVTRWFSDPWRAANPALVKKATEGFLANDFECYAATCALLGDADLRHYLPAFKMPVAIVVGEEDFATPVAMAKSLHEALPQSTLKVILGGRHLTPIECPNEIATELTRLLERL